jgi:hypothetical protein
MIRTLRPLALLFAATAALATVEDSGSIDLVSIDKSNTEVSLSVVQHLGWNSRSLSLLDAKLRNYVAFVESGQLRQSVPEWKGKSVVIHVSYFEEPTPTATERLSALREALSKRGLSLTWSALKAPSK